MTEFVRVGALDQLPDGGRLRVEFDEETVIVFNVGGVLYCIADMCTHDGEPLDDGELVDCLIECPRHGALFDIRTGKPMRLPATEAVPTFQVKVVDGDIMVEKPRAW